MPVTITIIVAPGSGPGLFVATRDGVELCQSREPLLDAARALLRRGASPDTVLVMRHAGADHDVLRGRLGALARLTVEDGQDGVPRLRRWRPSQYADVAPPMRLPRQGLSDQAAVRLERVLARGRA